MATSPQPDNIHEIGERLRQARQALKISQVRAAEVCGASVTAYNNWERGNRTPSPNSMIKLWERYRISLDWIYVGDPRGLPSEIADTIFAAKHDGPEKHG